MEKTKQASCCFFFLLLVDAATAMAEDLAKVKGVAITFIFIAVVLIILMVVLAVMYLRREPGKPIISFPWLDVKKLISRGEKEPASPGEKEPTSPDEKEPTSCGKKKPLSHDNPGFEDTGCSTA